MVKQKGYLADWLFPAVLLVAFIGFVVLGLMYSAASEREWQRFAKAHACKVVAKREGHLSTGVAPIVGGQGGVAITTSVTPGQTAYLCDDGVTYWRND